MRRWLRRRRERAERIEIEADELVRLFGADAYSEARWREHTASSPASAQEWDLIAFAIARQNRTPYRSRPFNSNGDECGFCC